MSCMQSYPLHHNPRAFLHQIVTSLSYGIGYALRFDWGKHMFGKAMRTCYLHSLRLLSRCLVQLQLQMTNHDRHTPQKATLDLLSYKSLISNNKCKMPSCLFKFMSPQLMYMVRSWHNGTPCTFWPPWGGLIEIGFLAHWCCSRRTAQFS